MNQHNLVLYHFASCPYCLRVRRFLSANNLSVPEKDILLDPTARRELVEAGGSSQVPALMIDGEVLYESTDIIQWFARNFVQSGEAV